MRKNKGAANAALIIALLLMLTFFVPAIKCDDSGKENAGLYYITGSASDGGYISPSGTNSYAYLSNPSFTITPLTGYNINEIRIDGGKPFPASRFIYTQNSFNNFSKNVELAVVDGHRYILENIGIDTSIEVYQASSSWLPTSEVSSSPVAINDFFVPSISKNVSEMSLFPHCIVVTGNQAGGEGFLALFNITANSWTWESTPSINYVTDVLNPSGTDLVIQIADANHRGFVRTAKNDLFNSSAWSFVNLPASQTHYLGEDHLDTRIASFNGFIFTLSINAHYQNVYNSYSWCVYKYNLAESTWDSMDPLLSNYDTTVPGADSLYGMAWADNNKLFLVTPFSNGTWSIYYSTDGSAFKIISSVASVNNFHGYQMHPNAEHAWASTFDSNSDYILFETDALNGNKGYLAILDLNGTVIYRQNDYTAHSTAATMLLEERTPEGKIFLMGSAGIISEHSAFIQKLTVEYFTETAFTFTFERIAANHTISASFNSLSPTPISSPNERQFLIESNSTIAGLSFNATIPEIEFTVNGPTGTIGYVNATISKSLMPYGENIKIILDGSPYNCSISSSKDWWIITFTYHHSTHQVKIYSEQESGVATVFSNYFPYILAAVLVSLLGFLALIIWSARSKDPTTSG